MITFENSKNVPDDWYNSLLYWKVCNEKCGETVSKEEIEASLSQIPRTHDGILKGIENGLKIIEGYLLEMLGTQNDMETFRNQCKNIDLITYNNLYGKCEEMRQMREITVKILKKIKKRESAFESLMLCSTGAKEMIVYICKAGKRIRELIQMWLKSQLVPFHRFFFKKVDYLKKLEKDVLIIQDYL